MTIRECAIVETYTGIVMLTGENRKYSYAYMEELMGRPVYTHELADKEIVRMLKAKALPDFIELCRNQTADEWTEELNKNHNKKEANDENHF